MTKLAITLAACLPATSGVAQDERIIRVIDGDTFETDRELIRLWGIDAPELDQTCGGADEPLSSVGQIARQMLDTILMDLHSCDPVDTDRYGRTVAICATTQGYDIGAMMVGFGWAWEDVRYSDSAYADMTRNAEEQAGTPLYRGQCIPPWEWREQNSQ